MATPVANVKEAPEAQVAPAAKGRQEAPPDMGPGKGSVHVNEDGGARQYADGLDADTCRKHFRECGVDVPAVRAGEDENATAELRGKLERQLQVTASVA